MEKTLYTQDKFLQYLYSIGYKVYDKINGKRVEIQMPNNWSSHGHSTVFLFDGEREIYWGICRGLVVETTATLRVPLPEDAHDEASTLEIMRTKSPEEIYKSLRWQK